MVKGLGEWTVNQSMWANEGGSTQYSICVIKIHLHSKYA